MKRKWLEPNLTDLNVKRTENFGNNFYGKSDSSSNDSIDSTSNDDKDDDSYMRKHGLL